MDVRTRRRLALELAEQFDGVVTRQLLVRHGISVSTIRSEIRAERWYRLGRHTIAPGSPSISDAGRRWQAVWESGPTAVLDGATALVAHGMTGFDVRMLDVSVPAGNRVHRLPGVRIRRPRAVERSSLPGVPRTTVAAAAIRAARWAVSDRQAALVLCLPVQQRLVPATRLAAVWSSAGPGVRSRLIGRIVADLVDGAQSLGELDFAGWCRRRRLPTPARQVRRTGARGRSYLDAYFDEHGVVVEIDGGHHLIGLNPTDDALRANELTITSDRVLRIPLLGLRTDPEAFADQIARALGHRRPAHP